MSDYEWTFRDTLRLLLVVAVIAVGVFLMLNRYELTRPDELLDRWTGSLTHLE